MRKSQELTIKLSEARSKLNGAIEKRNSLTPGTEPDAAMIAELDTATKAIEPLEVQYRAAVTQEAAEDRGAARIDPADMAFRQLEGRVQVSRYLGAALTGSLLTGAEAELNQELRMGLAYIPHAALARPVRQDTEHRAVTPAPADVGANQQPIIPPVYARGDAAFIGVDMPSVAVGEAVYTILSTGAVPGVLAKDAVQAESTGVFTASVLASKRVQASFLFRIEDAASLAGMEQALRADLGMALSEKLDAELLAGVGGLLNDGITAPANPGAAAVFGDYIKELVLSRVDGRYAPTPRDARSLLGPATYAHGGALFLSNSNESAMGYVDRISGGIRVSAHVPAVASTRQDALVALGRERHAVMPVWSAIQIIRDEVTQAQKGQIIITAVQLFALKVLRMGGFARVRFQVA